MEEESRREEWGSPRWSRANSYARQPATSVGTLGGVAPSDPP